MDQLKLEQKQNQLLYSQLQDNSLIIDTKVDLLIGYTASLLHKLVRQTMNKQSYQMSSAILGATKMLQITQQIREIIPQKKNQQKNQNKKRQKLLTKVVIGKIQQKNKIRLQQLYSIVKEMFPNKSNFPTQKWCLHFMARNKLSDKLQYKTS